MDSARIVVDSLQNTERILLAERIHQKDRLSNNTLGLLALISLLAVMMFSGAFYFLMLEIRRRQNYERQLEKTVSDLLRTNQDLEQFTYVVSHHLQEPLRKLQTFSTRLMQKHALELDDNARFLMERMSSTAIQMQTLMADLLVYTGLGLHGDTADFEVLDLAKVFQKMVKNHEKQLSSAKAIVQFDKISWQVRGDMEQLELLFSHLLQNSLKFARENQRPHISVHTFVTTGDQVPFATQKQHDERFVKIVFTDNGIGIDMQYQDKVFELFQRLHAAENYPGTGVGLAVCKRIVKRHNGYIHLAETESGAAFHIYLPIEN
jgi:light-regulated signal transduction histidine kinase (bacteriophytochrome)